MRNALIILAGVIWTIGLLWAAATLSPPDAFTDQIHQLLEEEQ